MPSGSPHDELDLLRAEARVLNMVAIGAGLAETLDALVAAVEAQEPGLRCGILITAEDGACFRRGVGATLPERYHAALDGISILPPYLGACGEFCRSGRAGHRARHRP